MEIDHEDSGDNLRRVRLSGRMDIPGTASIDARFAALTATAARRVIVDLKDVSFLASIGIRSIISNAKALQSRGGRMVLLVGADDSVAKTLVATGVDLLIPTYSDAAEAEKTALA